MKRFWWLFIIAVIIIAASLTYILIPANIIVSNYVYIKSNPSSIVRYLHNENKWFQWLSEKPSKKNFIYGNYVYKPINESYSSLSILITYNNADYDSHIIVLPVGADSSAVQWQLQFSTSLNPVKRFMQYESAKDLHDNITYLLSSFKANSAYTVNVYGFDIKFTTLTDTAVVSTKIISKRYPSTQTVYRMIDILQNYVKQQHATQHNYPMLNVTQLQDSSYEVSVGIPTNIPLEGVGNIEFKRMIMLKNKTLITTVTGDNNNITKAIKATGDFMDDNKLSSPVIPFEQLITNRRKQTDSTKWVTKIFTPII